MLFDILPSNLCLGILAYLEWNDLVTLKLVCRKSNKLASDQRIWARECLRCYITLDLENLR